MRHIERSHGVCISWMHEMFTRDYMYLAYEVTDRMATDIYTKAFNDGRKWKHACLQIGLLDPSLLSDPDTLKRRHCGGARVLTLWGSPPKNVEKADSRGWGVDGCLFCFLFHNSTRVPPYPFLKG